MEPSYYGSGVKKSADSSVTTGLDPIRKNACHEGLRGTVLEKVDSHLTLLGTYITLLVYQKKSRAHRKALTSIASPISRRAQKSSPIELPTNLFTPCPGFNMPINQPSNQIKFTNVSVVRLKKGESPPKRLYHWQTVETHPCL